MRIIFKRRDFLAALAGVSTAAKAITDPEVVEAYEVKVGALHIDFAAGGGMVLRVHYRIIRRLPVGVEVEVKSAEFVAI